MLVGGRWSGWGRARAHTIAYARAYFIFGLLGLLYPPVLIAHFISLIVVVPGALFANVLYVRLFPRISWVREPSRAWMAGLAGILLIWVGTLTWVTSGGQPPDIVRRLGAWGIAIYVLGIPVLFSNLGVLIGYLIPRAVPRSADSGPPPPAVA